MLSAGIWVFYAKRQMGILYAKMWNMNNEMNRHAISLEINNMLPLPWETDDIKRTSNEKKDHKGADVVYLYDE